MQVIVTKVGAIWLEQISLQRSNMFIETAFTTFSAPAERYVGRRDKIKDCRDTPRECPSYVWEIASISGGESECVQL